MARQYFFNPFSLLFTMVLTLLLISIVVLLFVGALRTAFTRIGFSWDDALLILLTSLLGSGVNIPLTTLESSAPVVRDAHVRVFGITYRMPFREQITNRTTIAVNLGGAIIPTLVSIYLLLQFPSAIRYALAATAIVALATHKMARPVKGLGIVTPALLPPLVAALSALILIALSGAVHELAFVTAYVGGTLGTLIGADLLNLDKIRDLGAPMASIGGAGTFDGVFLTGIIAVLIL